MLHALETVRSGMPSARQRRVPQRRHLGPAADARGGRHARAASTTSRRAAGSARAATRSSGASATPRAPPSPSALSSDPERIALTHSTSGGINLVLGGMTFAAGDEVVTTDNEHAGLLEPLAALGRALRRRGARGRGAARPGPARCCHRAHRAAHALVAISHVLWANGRILPLRAISEAAHAAGAPLLIDGAQGVGAIDVDPVALGADAYAGPGQKWLCGPNGVGFLWVADGFEDRFEVAAPSYYTRDFRSEGQPFWPGARRHDGASLSTAGLAGLAAAVSFRRELVGWSEGAAEMAGVRARCVALLREVPGVTLQAESEGAAPLVAFTVDGPLGGGRRQGARGEGRARAFAARARLGARLARLLGLGRRPRAPGRRAARTLLMAPGELHARRQRRPCARRAPGDGARRGGDAGLHARRHARDRQGSRSARARAARRPGHPRQHLPPALPPGRGADRGARRPAPLHGLGSARCSPIPAVSRCSRSPRRAASTPTA